MDAANEFSWKTAVNINIVTLKLLGLWPQGDDTYKFNFYAIYATFWIIGFLCALSFAQMINIYFILDDLETFTSSIYVTLACAGVVAKAYYLVKNMKSLKQLFININDEIFKPKTDDQKALLEISIRSWKRFYVLCIMACCNGVSLWTSYPILDKWIKEYKLPFLAWYPYDTKISPFYEMTYVHQSVAILYLVIVSMNIDCLIAGLNMFTGAQCDLLCYNLRNLGTSDTSKIDEDLVECIEHHHAILRFVQEVNHFYEWIVFLQFFTSTISVAVSMFNLTVFLHLKVQRFSGQFYLFVFYTIAIAWEVYMYCWFGNEIEIKSSAIPYAAFECNWVGSSLSSQKSLIIFAIRTMVPIKVSAFNLFYLSLDTFKAILRTSWSYFAVLNQVNS